MIKPHQDITDQLIDGNTQVFRDFLNSGDDGSPVLELNLFCCELRENGVVAAEIIAASSVHTLDMRSNNLAQHGVEVAQHLASESSKVHTLNMSFNDLGQHGVEIAQHLASKSSSVHTLSMRWNDLQQHGPAAANTLQAKGFNCTAASLEGVSTTIPDARLIQNFQRKAKAQAFTYSMSLFDPKTKDTPLPFTLMAHIASFLQERSPRELIVNGFQLSKEGHSAALEKISQTLLFNDMRSVQIALNPISVARHSPFPPIGSARPFS
jgi:hypothetical protein